MRKVSNVFWISAAILLVAVILGVATPSNFEAATANIQSYITSSFGWNYLNLVTVVVIFCLLLMFSPIGAIRIGRPGEKPEYTKTTGFAMLFSAGMGIGLVFWGAAEPLSHFANNPPLAEPGS